MPSASKLDEVRVLIVSFLVARPGWTPITVLDNDYYNFEKNRIPFHQFGFASLLEFLQSMPQHFQLEKRNGHCHIRAFTSEKSKHVSSLVSRQRKPSKFTTPLRHRTSTYIPYVPRQRPKIPAEQLNNLVQYVRNNPEGINIISAMQMIQRTLPYVKLTEADIRDQLRELEHQVYITDDIIRPVGRSTFSSQSSNFNNRSRSPLMASEAPYNASESSTSNVVYTAPKPSTPNTVYTVPEECHNLDMDDMDDMDFVRPSNAQHSKRPKTDERLASSLKEHSDYKPTFNYYEYERQEKCNNIENIDDYFMKQEMVGSESDGLLNLVSERMRSRLEQLMQDYPDGILCSELPKLYLAKYNVSLNYADLGFNSVINFTSHLPDIFYARRENTYSDFILYSADKRPKHQDAADGQRISQDCDQETTSKMKPIDVNSPPKSHDMRKDNEPIPLDLSPDVLHKFAPENATTYEHISHILVTDLKRQVDENKNKFLEVYIVEVFTPSFFWIHLRKNTKQFDKFMKELGTFYNHSCQTYAIPKLGLQRGLNCACVFAGMWHRGVVKNVKPDFRVTIMFYDYGTQKTYAPEEIYYLDKRFTDLPAQAIPCGLYNVKPYVGERWKKSITDRFIDRISDSVLAATIVTIDPPNNSMMIVLSDTSEEEDVHINDWLVQENLARSGKMVRTNENFPFEHYYMRHIANASETVKTVVRTDTNKMIRSRNQIASSHNKNMYRPSNAKISERFMERDSISRKVSSRQVDTNMRENNARIPSDTVSRSRHNPASGNKPKEFGNLAKLVELIKAKHAKLLSSPNVFKFDANEDDVRQVDSDAKVETEPRCNDRLSNNYEPQRNNGSRYDDAPQCNDEPQYNDEPQCNYESWQSYKPRHNDALQRIDESQCNDKPQRNYKSWNGYKPRRNDELQRSDESWHSYKPRRNDALQRSDESRCNDEPRRNDKPQRNYKSWDSYEPRRNDELQYNEPQQRNDEPQHNDRLQCNVESQRNDEPRRNDKRFNYERMKKELNRNFDRRDSDEETSINERDFGTFHSMYGGHGDMTPFDWSLVRQMDSPLAPSSRDSNFNLDASNTNVKKKTVKLPQKIRCHRKVNDQVKEVTESFIPKLARMETEYFLTDGNIDHDGEDVSQAVTKLRRRLETQDDNCTEMVISRQLLEKLRTYAEPKSTTNCNVPVSSSSECIKEFDTSKHDKKRETRINQETENKDPNSESAKLPRDLSSPSIDAKRQQRTSNDTFSSECQILRDRIVKEDKFFYDSSLGSSTKGWSSGPEPLSCHSHSSTDETLISSDDEQREAFSRKNVMSRFNNLQHSVKESTEKFTSLSSKSDPDVGDSVSCATEMLQRVLKIPQKSDTEQLDSDDLSNNEYEDDVTSDRSMILDASKTSDLEDNNAQKVLVAPDVPILDDRDIESDDSSWDVYPGR